MIEGIGNVLFSEQFNFEPQRQSFQHNKENVTEGHFYQTGTTVFNQTQTANQAYYSRPSAKNRSLSFGNGKRKLSKTNCFAEAKKLNVPTNVQITRN